MFPQRLTPTAKPAQLIEPGGPALNMCLKKLGQILGKAPYDYEQTARLGYDTLSATGPWHRRLG